jgi:hypothetical protein
MIMPYCIPDYPSIAKRPSRVKGTRWVSVEKENGEKAQDLAEELKDNNHGG